MANNRRLAQVGSFVGSTSSDKISFQTNTGIGTTNPTSRLTVDGDTLITGVITATNFSGDLNTSGIVTATTFSGNISGVAATFTGNVTIGGTLTYEDVTNIDAIGLITARNGLQVLSGITTLGVSEAINLNATGIITANTFSGSGASLTNIPNGALDNSSVSYGGVSLSLGGSDDTPAFNLADATGLPVSTGISGLGANVATFLATPSSSNLASAVTGETGSGALVFATSPTLVTPALGQASATSINATGVITATTFDGSLATSDLTGTITNDQLAGSITNAKLVNSSVSFGGVSVSLGSADSTPAFNLADATGLPVSTGISGLGANVATFLATPSSANLASAVTGETGSGALVFATSPTLVTPTLGQASATSINASGIVTATGGFNLGISSAGTTITSGNPVTTLNFIGAGNTFAFNGTTVDISIAGGAGGGGGVSEVETTVSTTSATGVGSFAVATYRSADVIAQISQGSNYQVGRYLMIHDGTTVTVVEESSIATGSMLGSFNGVINGANAELRVTLVSAGTAATVTTKIDTVTIP